MEPSFSGGVRLGKRGRGAEGTMLVRLVVEDTDRGIGRIRLSPIPDAPGETIKTATLPMVDPESTIRSAGWDGYNMLT